MKIGVIYFAIHFQKHVHFMDLERPVAKKFWHKLKTLVTFAKFKVLHQMLWEWQRIQRAAYINTFLLR